MDIMDTTADTPVPMPKLLTDKQVAAMLGVSRPYVWRLKAMGFPEPLRISPRFVRWRESDVAAWIDKKANERPTVPNSPATTKEKEAA